MAITDWPTLERPREKLLQLRPASLSDAELLAILPRTGVRGKSAVDPARDLLVRCGILGALFAAKRAELASLPGLGDAKFSQLQAVLEMARRALAETLRSSDALGSPGAVRDFLRLTLASRDHGVFLFVLLDARNRVIACEELFRGTLTQTSVYPREVVICALARNAAAVIFAHFVARHKMGISCH
jgi:DNA repair protein RadC